MTNGTMYARIGARKLFLYLLITTVLNADRIKEGTLTYDINVRCAVLFASFGNVSCEQGFVISVINAHYGHHNSSRDVSESCSIQPDDCLLSVPLHSISYYNDILEGCSGKESCDSDLVAEEFNGGASCDGFTANDYVLIQFYCLPSEATIETVDVCMMTDRQGAINCTGNCVIQIVGAILGFQPVADDWCTYGVDRCRIQPDLDHLEVLRSNCQGKEECQFNATTSISRVNHPCDSLNYTFETVTYYCSENSGTLVTGISECTSAAPNTVPVTSVVVSTTSMRTTTTTTPETVPVTSVTISKSSSRTTTSTTPSTVRVTSVTHSSSSLSASSTTGGATIASNASTYTVIDNLGNVSTTATDTSSTDDTTSIIVGSVVGGVVLIILLLLLIFIIWRRRNSEDTSKRRRNSSDKGVNGLSDNTSMPTHSLGNIYELAQDQLHPPVYWLAHEQSITANTLTQEQFADYYSEIEDLHVAQAPYLSLYSNSTGFHKEIDKSNAGVYVNVTEPSKVVYSLVQKTSSSTHPVGSEFLPVDKFEFTNRVRIDNTEEKVSALAGHQSVQRPADDLVLRENSLYGATETHSPNDADDKSELAKVRIDNTEEKMSAMTRHKSVQRPEDDLVLRENSLYGATETHSPNDAVGKSELAKVRIDNKEEKMSAMTRHKSVQRPENDLVLRENSIYGATETNSPHDAVGQSELAKVRIDNKEEKVSAMTRHQSVQRPEDDLVLRENSLYGATETHSPNDAVDELTLTDNDLYA